MKNALVPLILLGCVAMMPSGCADPSAVVVAGLRMELTGMQRAPDGSVSVAWRMVNPNIVPYLLTRISGKIYLDGTLAGTILHNEPMGIPAQGQVVGTSRLTPAGSATDRILTAAIGRGTAGYRVDSHLTIQITGEQREQGEITTSGSVKVAGK